MTGTLHAVRFPGESDAYRAARDRLLEREIELRGALEAVAALRRELPLGGRVKEDYVFDEANRAAAGSIALSKLFEGGKRSLIVYSYMYGPAAEQPCPMCTSFLDGVNAYAPHITQRVNLVVVARSPAERLRAWAARRGWDRLRLLSSASNTYNADYAAETPDGQQLPACNVFTSTDAGIYHFWSAEMLYAPTPGHARHVDLLWPIWSFFDLTPEGRGKDWLPKLSYP
ncbi:MAG: DUF899 domain-containing protein [Deltaproteobacteria bacterium]|nr:MAG: DUF899 domain-containing protein [Deltaproteobacteria bacterium]